ncbi:MAG: hypothetical protein B6D37_09820 [Sphingobacteriales bacterium UTBCD1]|jgi:hypothetical protein|nr:MAG: hypothetical protein B6D37_09820 [Sphingobacteriales bacterium UTBCD1]
MKKKKPLNKFDALVEKLVQEFIKIPNFDLTSSDEVVNRAFNIIAFRIADISSYKELVCQHFIPATNKAIFEGQRDFNNSRYKFLLKTKDHDFKETLYDTIRLAYVGLFHKLENYINDVIQVSEVIFGELYETNGTVTQWAKEKFNFDIRNWQQFSITHKINWICNCVKHKDGLPVKLPKPDRFKYDDETQRIKITPEEFKQDCELLIKFYPVYLQAIFLFAQHKLATEKPLKKEDYEFSPDLYELQVENRNKLETAIQGFVKLLKDMA